MSFERCSNRLKFSNYERIKLGVRLIIAETLDSGGSILGGTYI